MSSKPVLDICFKYFYYTKINLSEYILHNPLILLQGGPSSNIVNLEIQCLKIKKQGNISVLGSHYLFPPPPGSRLLLTQKRTGSRLHEAVFLSFFYRLRLKKAWLSAPCLRLPAPWLFRGFLPALAPALAPDLCKKARLLASQHWVILYAINSSIRRVVIPI